jgi:hypothetical protein
MEETKRIPVKIQVEVHKYLIHFTYDTRKGHYKTQQRSIEHLNEDSALQAFKEWAKTVRTMSNVKILGIFDNKSTRAIEVEL